MNDVYWHQVKITYKSDFVGEKTEYSFKSFVKICQKEITSKNQKSTNSSFELINYKIKMSLRLYNSIRWLSIC